MTRMSTLGSLDVAGVCFTVLGVVWCVVAMIQEPGHSSVAAALAIISGLALLFWLATAIRRHNPWPVRFPESHGDIGVVNGMVAWWCMVGCVVAIILLSPLHGADGLWYYVGVLAALVASNRMAYAYSERGWHIIRGV